MQLPCKNDRVTAALTAIDLQDGLEVESRYAVRGQPEVVRWDLDPLGPGVLLHIGGTSVPLAVDRVLLATGFDPARPGGSLVADAIDAHGLRCAACGYPVVATLLRWHPRLHVMGPLADLDIGPVSRNIIGARLAATRLVHTHLSS